MKIIKKIKVNCKIYIFANEFKSFIMKFAFRILSILFLLSFINYHIFSQNTEKVVTITSTGTGTNQDEAKQVALKSAIEQAFGAFVSSKTEVLNDQVVSDQITSVSSGNIQSYEVINESKISENNWISTVKAVVSVDKLISFVQSKGVSVEINGGLFMLNIKQQALNESGETNTIYEMAGRLHEMFQNSFDFSINSKGFESLDAENKNFKIPLEVSVVANNNIDICNNYIMKVLKSISLTNAEKEDYEKLKKEIYTITIEQKGYSKSTLYLRKELSLRILNSLFNNWDFYTRNFIAKRDDIELIEPILEYIHKEPNSRKYFIEPALQKLDSKGGYYNSIFGEVGGRTVDPERCLFIDEKIGHFRLFNPKESIGKINWSDFQNYKELEILKAYTIKSNGISSKFKEGGYVLFENSDGHGLAVTLAIIGWGNHSKAEMLCKEISFSGYRDFRLPTTKELEIIGSTLVPKLILNLITLRDVPSYVDFGNFRYGPAFWSNSSTGVIFNGFGEKIQKGLNPNKFTYSFTTKNSYNYDDSRG